MILIDDKYLKELQLMYPNECPKSTDTYTEILIKIGEQNVIQTILRAVEKEKEKSSRH